MEMNGEEYEKMNGGKFIYVVGGETQMESSEECRCHMFGVIWRCMVSCVWC